jgi:hypothetical protein
MVPARFSKWSELFQAEGSYRPTHDLKDSVHMDTPSHKLVPVMWTIRLAGYSQEIHPNHMRFDPKRSRLVVKTYDNLLVFHADDDFALEVIDLSVPEEIRRLQRDGGWMPMCISEFISILAMDELSFG